MNIIATGLYYIWKSRCEKKSAQSYKMRADIEASILIVKIHMKPKPKLRTSCGYIELIPTKN